jgi:competence protein ComGC
VRSIHRRNAARPIHADELSYGEVEGFTFVEMVIGLLIAGIFVAIVVFSVFTVTHPAQKPDPACTNEVNVVNDAIVKYKLLNNNTYPRSLDALVKSKPRLLQAVPSPTGPSRSRGYDYNVATGTYDGGSCLRR